MHALWTDVRHALRFFARRPGFFLIVVITLALGIGSTTAIYSLVHGILLEPLPFEDPGRVLTIWQSKTKGDGHLGKVAPGNFVAWRDESDAFETMASAEPFGFDLLEGDQPERISGWLVSPGFFRVLGVEALHGRTFLPEEEAQADGGGPVVLSYGMWKQRYGGEPSIVGQDLLLSGGRHRIVGVMPLEFDFPTGRELWMTRRLTSEDKENRTETNLTVVGRLAPGKTIGDAEASLQGISVRLSELFPTSNSGIEAAAMKIEEHIVGGVRSGLLLLLFAVGFVHLIVCTNVGNLILVQGLQRRSEMACRAALGAGRGRLLQQMLVESVLLALIGTVPGIFLAFLGVQLASRQAVVDVPRLAEVAIDPWVIGFAILLAVATGIVFSLVPNLRLSRLAIGRDLVSGRDATASGLGSSRGRRFLIAFEVALAVVLLVATGLLLRSFEQVLRVDPGFETENVAVLETHVWSRFGAPDERATFFSQALERLHGLPDVAAAGAVSALPLFRGRAVREIPFFIDGREPPTPDQQPIALHTLATLGYFETLRIPLFRGRLFTTHDDADSRGVALVNQEMAERYWPDEDPVGQRVLVHFLGAPALREIIGVVGNARQTDLMAAARPELFIPHLQNPFGSMTFVVRGKSSSAGLVQAAMDEIRLAAPGLPFSSTSTLEGMIGETLAPRRWSLRLLGFFGLMALLLAGMGVYGLVSSSTLHRRREIGLRMAMGGRPVDILKMLLREGVVWILGGLVFGCIAAVTVTRWLESFLFGVSFYDPLTLIGVMTVMCAVGLLAIYLPAKAAMGLDPMVALSKD